MLKILQIKLQHCVNRGLPGVQAGFRKGRGTKEQIAKVCWIIVKAPIDVSPPGPPVPGILQARVLVTKNKTQRETKKPLKLGMKR